MRSQAPLRVQPKLTIGPAGDVHEQEADRVAAAVMRMPGPQASGSVSRGTPGLQRCSCGGACEECKGTSVQRVSTASPGSTGVPAPPAVHEVLSSPGQSLDTGTRSFMEQRFGHDFGHVRVHTGTQAADSARDVNALAYTVGSDVVFAAGQYAPQTEHGKQLIAHELTHVVQQGRQRSTLQRAIHFDPPAAATREDPIPKILRNQKDLGLTTPMINGTVLTNSRSQIRQVITNAFRPKEVRVVSNSAGNTQCAFADLDVAVSAQQRLPTRPVGHRWGPNNFDVTQFQDPGIGDRCQHRGTVPVTMLGIPDADAVADWVEGNEQEHVDDLRKIVEKTLIPYFNWLMAMRGTAANPGACADDIQKQWTEFTLQGRFLGNLIEQFAMLWLYSVRQRDGGGGHTVHTTSLAKGKECDRVEITAERHH